MGHCGHPCWPCAPEFNLCIKVYDVKPSKSFRIFNPVFFVLNHRKLMTSLDRTHCSSATYAHLLWQLILTVGKEYYLDDNVYEPFCCGINIVQLSYMHVMTSKYALSSSVTVSPPSPSPFLCLSSNHCLFMYPFILLFVWR